MYDLISLFCLFVLTNICVRRVEVKGIDTRSDQSEARTRRREQNWGQQSKTIQYPAPYHCHDNNHPNKTDSSLWKKIKQLCSVLSFIALVNYELFDVLDALARVTISLKHKSTLENVENQYRHVGWLCLDEHQEWAKFLPLFCNSFVFLGKLYLDQNAFYGPTYFGDSRYLFAFEDKSIFWKICLAD